MTHLVFGCFVGGFFGIFDKQQSNSLQEDWGNPVIDGIQLALNHSIMGKYEKNIFFFKFKFIQHDEYNIHIIYSVYLMNSCQHSWLLLYKLTLQSENFPANT